VYRFAITRPQRMVHSLGGTPSVQVFSPRQRFFQAASEAQSRRIAYEPSKSCLRALHGALRELMTVRFGRIGAKE